MRVVLQVILLVKNLSCHLLRLLLVRELLLEQLVHQRRVEHLCFVHVVQLLFDSLLIVRHLLKLHLNFYRKHRGRHLRICGQHVFQRIDDEMVLVRC